MRVNAAMPTSTPPPPPASGALHVLGRLARYGRPFRGLFAAAVLASVVLNVANLVRPLLVKTLTDDVLTASGLTGRYGFLAWLLAAMLGATLLKGLFTWLQGILLNRASQGCVRGLREHAYDHLMRLPIAWFDRQTSGELITRFTDDLRMVTELLTTGLLVITNDTIVLVTSLAFMIAKDVQLTVLAMIVTPAAGIVVRRYARRLTKATDDAHEQLSELTSHVHETVSGIKQVKAFNREGDESERFRGKNQEAFRHAMQLVRLTATQNPIMEVLATSAIAIVMWYCALRIMSGQLTLGDLLAFWAYMLLATTPINRLPQTTAVVSRGVSAGARLFALLDTPVEASPAPRAPGHAADAATPHVGNAPLPAPDALASAGARPRGASLAFDDVHMRYRDDRPEALRGVTLAVARGERVAVVGRNGAGKSTFANLLARFYSCAQGHITLDGAAIETLPLDTVRAEVGLVAQEVFLFSGTIRDNIGYGREGATDDEIAAAAKVVGAHDFIVTLPDGYDHMVNERGANLSGGQRQRVALARTLLADPRVTVLDEATASLDPLAEAALEASLRTATAGRTVIEIAHRATVARAADRIVVLDAGRVVEQGTHDSLLQEGGVYAALFAEAQRPS